MWDFTFLDVARFVRLKQAGNPLLLLQIISIVVYIPLCYIPFNRIIILLKESIQL